MTTQDTCSVLIVSNVTGRRWCENPPADKSGLCARHVAMSEYDDERDNPEEGDQ